MAGTSVPYFLYPTGSPPVVVNGSVRSLFAFWMGGASAAPFTPPPPQTDGGGGYGHYTAREYYRALLERIRAAQRAKDRKKKLQSIAREVAHEAEPEVISKIEAIAASYSNSAEALVQKAMEDLDRHIEAMLDDDDDAAFMLLLN